jgi:hypothetical protein
MECFAACIVFLSFLSELKKVIVQILTIKHTASASMNLSLHEIAKVPVLLASAA